MGQDLVGVPVQELVDYAQKMHTEIVDLYPGDVSKEEILKYQALVYILVADVSKPERLSPDVYALGQSVIRMGYLTREYEVATFGPLDHVHPGFVELLDMRLAQEVESDDAVGAVCFEWAQVEPDNPGPEEPSLLWMIPGTGGQVRNQLAHYVIDGVTPENGLPEPLTYGVLLTCWRFGFFSRCALEVLADRGPTEQETREAAERLGWNPSDNELT